MHVRNTRLEYYDAAQHPRTRHRDMMGALPHVIGKAIHVRDGMSSRRAHSVGRAIILQLWSVDTRSLFYHVCGAYAQSVMASTGTLISGAVCVLGPPARGRGVVYWLRAVCRYHHRMSAGSRRWWLGAAPISWRRVARMQPPHICYVLSISNTMLDFAAAYSPTLTMHATMSKYIPIDTSRDTARVFQPRRPLHGAHICLWLLICVVKRRTEGISRSKRHSHDII